MATLVIMGILMATIFPSAQVTVLTLITLISVKDVMALMTAMAVMAKMAIMAIMAVLAIWAKKAIMPILALLNWFERPGNMSSKIISTLLRSDVVSDVVTCMYVISRDAIASKNCCMIDILRQKLTRKSPRRVFI